MIISDVIESVVEVNDLLEIKISYFRKGCAKQGEMKLVLNQITLLTKQTCRTGDFVHGVKSLHGLVNPKKQPGHHRRSLYTDGV